MKRWLRSASVLALTASLMLSGCGSGSGSSAKTKTVPVQSVAMLTDQGSVGVLDRYTGVVTSQKQVKIQKDSGKTVAEVKVSVGDTVKKGDVLFTYDLESLKLSVEQGKLEIEKLTNSIESQKQQIEQLEKEKKKASKDNQLDYTIQIQELQAEQKENEYNLEAKKKSQKSLESSLGDTDVKSSIDGVVQSISKTSDDSDDSGEASIMDDSDSGDSSAFMVLTQTGNYRVQGTVNEMNRAALLGMDGQTFIIRSRADLNQTWTGKLEKVDTENPTSSNSSGYDSMDDGDSSGTSSTNYPFYIAVDDPEGMMMGQHVYIEPDQGQGESKSGLWLASYFIGTDEDGKNFVWAANSSDKLEKRSITVGEYNQELDEYEVTDGLTTDDYVAIVDINLKEGAAVTRYDEEYFEEESESFDESDDSSGDDSFDEDMDMGSGELSDASFGDDEILDDFSDESLERDFSDMDLSDGDELVIGEDAEQEAEDEMNLEDETWSDEGQGEG